MRVTKRILTPFVQGDKLLNVIEGRRRGRLALPVAVMAMLTAAGTSAPAAAALYVRGLAGGILHHHCFP